ncbi:type-1 angiotensin II receptor A-like [Ostrea edulis]|uniref:type-1 angiotensin II receptor A-like n=1 Tax=Ostrea edulis TaxID=37623 RepID=UPI0020943363|nr:type-1 angiotensin II receptor A-like [Ostrea edulis]XP_048742143.1 type-1 angiotensin II receptor A-like [Ostrea edulis]XP_056001288.1 type-1 angiotensin II receptor A-like [Ostrea edulis]
MKLKDFLWNNLIMNTTWNASDNDANPDVTLDKSRQALKLFIWKYYDSSSLQGLAVFILLIGTIGLIGNAITVVKILFDKKFHKPTYAAIGCLAVPDFCMIIVSYLAGFTNIDSYLRFNFPCEQYLISMCDLFDGVFYLAYFSSLGHVICLFTVRYLLTVHPLQSRKHVTASVVTGSSGMMWCISFVLSITAVSIIKLNVHLTTDESYFAMAILRAVVGFIPVCIIVTLHCLKLKTLRNSSVRTGIRNRMNLVIAVILLVFTSYQIFVIFFPILWVLDMTFNLEKSAENTFYTVMELFGFLHFSCNPYIYFFISFCSK